MLHFSKYISTVQVHITIYENGHLPFLDHLDEPWIHQRLVLLDQEVLEETVSDWLSHTWQVLSVCVLELNVSAIYTM